MNKTLRSSSLPQLKPLTQTPPFKHLVEPVSRSLKSAKNDQIMQIGSYTINREYLLGRGFCSSVFKGQHNKTGQTVAIKIVELEKIKEKIQKRLIKSQIKSLHQLKASKNILNLHEIITTKQYVAFVTEICKESLLQKLKSNNASKKQPLQRTEAIKVLKEILNGYYQMREYSLLHRDLKPANILIGLDGEARLGDFGFSIRDEQVQQDKNVNIGSPLYMAPEVLKGNKYSSKADMWSIGLIFLEMLIGDLPWANVKQSHLHEKLLQINFKDYLPNNLSEKHQEMLLKCLEVDPRKRIGVRQMMGYLFNKQQLLELVSESKCSSSQRIVSAKIEKVSIPTTITENQEQKNQTIAADAPTFQRSNNSIKNLYVTNSYKFIENPLIRNSKSFSSRKLRLKDHLDAKGETPVALKLKLNGPLQQQEILKQQMSELHFCRFLFKMVQLIAKGENNIHNTYFNLTEKLSIELSQCILYTLEQIRLIKSDFNIRVVRQFRKSKQFRKVLELTEQYENNYIQFFEIQLKAEVEGRLIDPEGLIHEVLEHISNGKEHFKLILEEVEKSELKFISDNQICQFTYLIHFMIKLVEILKVKKKGRQGFVKYGKIQQLANTSLASISLNQLRRIHQKLDN